MTIFDAQGNPLPSAAPTEGRAREFGDFVDKLLKDIEAQPDGLGQMAKSYEGLAVQMARHAEQIHAIVAGDRVVDLTNAAGRAMLKVMAQMTMMALVFVRKQVYAERDLMLAAKANGKTIDEIHEEEAKDVGSDSPGAVSHDDAGAGAHVEPDGASNPAGEGGSGAG